MNIKGIQLLDQSRFPAPRGRVVFTNPSEINVKRLYQGAPYGVAVMAFDADQRITENPFDERSARRYRVERKDFENTLVDLKHELEAMGIAHVVFSANQMYTLDNIAFCGRAGIVTDKQGFGRVNVEAIPKLRVARGEFTPDYVYDCPVVGTRVFRSQGSNLRQACDLPQSKLDSIIRDLGLIPGNGFLDFEVYADSGELFYHDLFLVG